MHFINLDVILSFLVSPGKYWDDQIRSQPLSCTPLPVHDSLIILSCHVYSVPLTASLNETQQCL
jgi:hypothetical protein